MTVEAPLIVKKSYDEVVSHIEILLQEYSTWQPSTSGYDAASTLVRIFARFAELVTDRVNQVPDKHFLAFLDMVGLELKPPQPARVPLTFTLAEGGMTDTVVPKYTRVAAILGENETEPVIFETESELVATRSKLVYAYAREPEQDRFRTLTSTASGANELAFPLFEGDKAITHQFYLSHAEYYAVEDTKDITISVRIGGNNTPWLMRIDWFYWNGDDWVQPGKTGITQQANNTWEIVLHDVPAISLKSVNGLERNWLKAKLETSIPRINTKRVDPISINQYKVYLSNCFSATVPIFSGPVFNPPLDEPENAYINKLPLDLEGSFYPFGEEDFTPSFYIPCGVAFSKPAATITISVNLDALRMPQASADLKLFWFFWGEVSGSNGGPLLGWNTLGDSTPVSTSGVDSGFNYSDDTRAFTQDGTITFNCPANWKPHSIDGLNEFWLCASILQGNYGSGSSFRPPVVDTFSLDYGWPLPLIDRVRTRIHMADSNTLPDLAYTNQQPVDLSKTFIPFGEKPKLGDSFYFRCDDGFSNKPGANITISFTMDSVNSAVPSTNPALVLLWEFWNGTSRHWEELSLSTDTTNRFSSDGEITFLRPTAMARSEVNGEFGHWLRVSIRQGNYGSEAHYEPVLDSLGNPVYFPDTRIQQYQLIPADFRPPYVVTIQLDYNYTSTLANPDHVISDNDHRFANHGATSQTINTPFHPFTLTADAEPTLYMGFERTGDNKGFDTGSNTLYFGVAEVPYDKAQDDASNITEKASLEWEYWDGRNWKELGVEDETEGLNKSGQISFIGPKDFIASSEFSTAAFWLRARWVRGEYANMPALQRILTNTVWARHTATHENNILGSSNGEPHQVFQIQNKPVLSGEQLEIKEPDQPSTQERELINKEEGDDAIQFIKDAGGRTREVWVRWHRVPDFYGSGPRSRHYILDSHSGEVRFGDGVSGLIPPQGRANVRIGYYQSGGGTNGNRVPGSITQLKSTVPAIDSVTNWETAGGGGPQETLESVKSRGPKTLRHRDRAVAIADFEDLAFEASTNVARVKGVAANDASSSGRAGLIIVPNNKHSRPVPSTGLLSLVKDYIQQRLSPTVDVWVAGPDWLRVSVAVELVPVSISEATNVKNAVLNSLATFLHPLTGGLDGQGWAFGRKPYRSDLYSRIENIEGVDYVRHLEVKETGEVTTDQFLVYSGTHNIVVVGDTSA